MENYTRIIGATSTNIRTPTPAEIAQGNDQLTPFESSKNNGYNFEMSKQIGNISEELTNLIISQGLTPDGTLTQVEEAINLAIASNSTLLPIQITVSNGTDTDHDIDFTAGTAILSDNTGQVLATAETKQIDSVWVAGTNQGGMAESLTVATDSTYHKFVLADDDNNFVGFGFDSSITASNLLAGANVIAAGGTKYKRISSLTTDGSANIRNGKWVFNRDGSYKFKYSQFILVNSIAVGVARGAIFMECPPNTDVIFNHTASSNVATLTYTIFTDLDESDIVPGNTTGSHSLVSANLTTGGQVVIRSNSSGNIGARASNASSTNIWMVVEGWIDNNL